MQAHCWQWGLGQYRLCNSLWRGWGRDSPWLAMAELSGKSRPGFTPSLPYTHLKITKRVQEWPARQLWPRTKSTINSEGLVQAVELGVEVWSWQPESGDVTCAVLCQQETMNKDFHQPYPHIPTLTARKGPTAEMRPRVGPTPEYTSSTNWTQRDIKK